MALRFYNLLADGVSLKRSYFPIYLTVLHPLFHGDLVDQNDFAFRLLDGNNEGKLESKDVSDII